MLIATHFDPDNFDAVAQYVVHSVRSVPGRIELIGQDIDVWITSGHVTTWSQGSLVSKFDVQPPHKSRDAA